MVINNIDDSIERGKLIATTDKQKHNNKQQNYQHFCFVLIISLPMDKRHNLMARYRVQSQEDGWMFGLFVLSYKLNVNN